MQKKIYNNLKEPFSIISIVLKTLDFFEITLVLFHIFLNDKIP